MEIFVLVCSFLWAAVNSHINTQWQKVFFLCLFPLNLKHCIPLQTVTHTTTKPELPNMDDFWTTYTSPLPTILLGTENPLIPYFTFTNPLFSRSREEIISILEYFEIEHISSGVPKSEIQEQNYYKNCNYTTVTNWFYIPSEQTVDIHLDPCSVIQPSLSYPCEARVLIVIQNQLVVNSSFERYSVIQREEPGCKSLWYLIFTRLN